MVIAVRAARVGDVDAILELERATPSAPHWSAAVYEEMLRAQAGIRVRRVFVAELLGSRDPVGLAGFAVGLAQRGEPSTGELESVVVRPALRRSGVGRALCAEVLRWAAGAGAATLELEVRAGNTAALGLYRSLGFAEFARRPRYYQDPVEDAVLMRRPLP